MTITDLRGRTVDGTDSSAQPSDPNAGLAIKTPVRCATTANITLAGLQTIDGVTVVADDRVLVKDQTTGSENGIYVASSGNWSRSADFDGSHEIVSGTQVRVTSGTVNGGSVSAGSGTSGLPGPTVTSRVFVITTADPIVIGTTSIAFAGESQGSTLLSSIADLSATAGLIASKGDGTAAARTLTGTSNRIAVTNGTGASGNPTVDISVSYAGQSTITTLGTVATGTWQATAVAAAYGGTGQTSYTVGDLLYASTTTALSKLPAVASGRVLASAGTGTAPAYSTTPTLGASGTAGSLTFGNATSGTVTVQPVTGALGTVTLSLPAATDTLVGKATTDTLTNKTLTTPVINGLPTGTGVASANTVSTLVARDGSGDFSAGTITASLSGNATTATSATSATNATNVAITDDTTTNATMYPAWVTTTTGNLPAKVSSTKLTFNPSTATLTTTTFSGALSGNATTATSATTATNATNTAVTDDTTTNATMYPTWVTTTTGNLPQKLSSTKLTFNPSTGTLTSTTFSGALSGNASTATALATARAIGIGGSTGLTAMGVNFDGTAAINPALTGTLAVANGGTNLTSGTSGGVLGYTASGTIASSVALTANGVVLGGGAGATPTSTAAGTNGQVLVGQTGSEPLWKTLSGDVTLAASGAATVWGQVNIDTAGTITANLSGGTYILFTPASAQTVSAFSNVVVGRIYIFHFNSNNTTITTGGAYLTGGASITPSINQSCVFVGVSTTLVRQVTAAFTAT